MIILSIERIVNIPIVHFHVLTIEEEYCCRYESNIEVL